MTSTEQSIRNYRDAEGAPVQPFYAAYMIDHGFARAAEGFGGGAYIVWIGHCWHEFEQATGQRPRLDATMSQMRFHLVDEFTDWLQARCDQIVARSEAA